MSDIIRRNNVVPVQARRAQPPIEQPSEMLQIPGAGPIPVPPAQPGVTQNIIYVNVPAGQPQAAPPPPADPAEIHVHNHIHQYPKRRRGGRYGASFLGTLGFVLGGVACGSCYVPQLLPLARFIAIAGVGCAALGLLGSLLFRKNSAGMPLFGLIVAGFSYGLWMMKTGQLPKAVQDAISQAAAAAPTAPAQTTPAPAVPTPPPVRIIPPSANTPPQDRTRLHDSSIFGDGGHWGNGTPTPTPATPTTPATPAPSVVTPPPAPAAPLIDSATAAANLESARLIAARKMGVDYATAKTTAADAKTECDQTRETAAPQSPELKAAWDTYLNAASKLTQIEKQLAADPAVAAAEQTLKAAKAAGK